MTLFPSRIWVKVVCECIAHPVLSPCESLTYGVATQGKKSRAFASPSERDYGTRALRAIFDPNALRRKGKIDPQLTARRQRVWEARRGRREVALRKGVATGKNGV